MTLFIYFVSLRVFAQNISTKYRKCSSVGGTAVVSIFDMLKFSAYVFHYHQPPDASNAKLFINHVLRRGRELLEKVRNGGRHGTTVPEVSGLPRVTPTVVYTKGTSTAFWQKSAAAWRSTLSSYLARNPSGGFVGRFAKNYRPQWAFGSWRCTDGYRGLGQKIAMFGFVGVAVSANGNSQRGLFDAGNDNVYSAIRVSLISYQFCPRL